MNWKVFVLLAATLLLAGTFAGCLEGDTDTGAPVESFIVKIIGGSHTLVAGDSTTYILTVTNQEAANATITATVLESPQGWGVKLSNTTFVLETLQVSGFIMVVNSSTDAQVGSNLVVVEFSSDLSDVKQQARVNNVIIDAVGAAFVGSVVSVDYIGYTLDYGIFDTSINDVGQLANTKRIQIHESYTPKGGFTPLEFTVGDGGMIAGFDQGVRGMDVGQSRTIIVEPKDGYGDIVTNTLTLTEELPVFETIRPHLFNTTYNGEQPIIGTVVDHDFWGWKVQVVEMDYSRDEVTLRHQPNQGEKSTGYGWNTTVTLVDYSFNNGEGKIVVVHDAPATGTHFTYKEYNAVVLDNDGTSISYEYNKSTNQLGDVVLVFEIKLVGL